MTEHLGILMIITGAVLLLTGIWLLRKSKAAGVAQQGGNAEGEHAVGGGTMALDLLGASIEACLVDGVLTPKEEALVYRIYSRGQGAAC